MDLDLCQGLNCQNGGSCVPTETTASCACAEGFAGDSCQYVIGEFQRDVKMSPLWN